MIFCASVPTVIESVAICEWPLVADGGSRDWRLFTRRAWPHRAIVTGLTYEIADEARRGKREGL